MRFAFGPIIETEKKKSTRVLHIRTSQVRALLAEYVVVSRYLYDQGGKVEWCSFFVYERPSEARHVEASLG